MGGPSPRMCAAARSAKAAMVSEGFGPTGPGMTDPSTTCSPG